MSRIKVKLTGVAICHFVRVMDVPGDEVEELLDDDDMIQNNLDHPDASFAIVEWNYADAKKEAL